MVTKFSKKFEQFLLLFLPISFLLFFLVLPILFTLLLSFSNISNGNFTIQNYFAVLNDPLNVYFIYWTFYESILSTILSIIIGLGSSYILSHYSIPGKKMIRNFLTIPFLLPSITVLIGFIAVFGNSIYSSNGVILANLFYNLPLMIRITELGWMSINPEYEVIAKSLSMNRLTYFLKVELPHLLPSLLTASLLVFIYSFNNFATVLVLTGSRYQTIEVRIYYLFFRLKFNQASALAVISLLINIIVIMVYLHFSSNYQSNSINYTYDTKELQQFRRYSFKNKLIRYGIFFLYATAIFVICVLPLFAIIQKSLIVNNTVTLRNYKNLLKTIIQPYGLTIQQMIYNSLFFATIVLIVSIVFSLLLNLGLHYKNTGTRVPLLSFDYLINIIVILPLMVSAVILIYSIFSLYKTTPLYSDISLVIIISHVLIAFPFANKIVASARATISQEMLDVGKSLGLNRTALFFKIELPLLWSGILVAGIFSFAISIGEFAATFFITRSNTATIPLGIYRLISLRDIAGASALSSILIIVTLGIFYFMERFSKFDLRI